MENITLSTGKTISAIDEVVGISKSLYPCVGTDGYIYIPGDKEKYGFDDDECEGHLTKAECVELADLMIARWIEFKNKFSAR